uniref:Uncharacterized protein n=1 Tax=Anguilla anguilla TaxID=7936 RepID=A0A0E9QS02_ANGAN
MTVPKDTSSVWTLCALSKITCLRKPHTIIYPIIVYVLHCKLSVINCISKRARGKHDIYPKLCC